MAPRVRIPLVTFLESFAAVLVQRAVYFYTKDRLGFSDTANLWLALTGGVAYVLATRLSHPLSRRIGERRLLLVVVAAQAALNAALASWPRPWTLFAGVGVLGVLLGLKWPVVESYTSAGLAPTAAARSVARFNLAWAGSIPLSLAAAGPLIAWNDWSLFVLAGSINVVGFLLICRLDRRPRHLPQDHPDRPDARRLGRLGRLQTSARWLLLASYASLWVLGALMPGVFRRLGFRAGRATAMWGLTDLARVSAFVVLGLSTRWHGRRVGLVRSMVLLPAGFVLMLFGRHLPVVLVGEALFGWGAGEAYYAALYYALVVENASVAAGGRHEGLIGLGFVIGPTAGLLGAALAPVLGDQQAGVLVVAGLVLGSCIVQSSRALLRAPVR